MVQLSPRTIYKYQNPKVSKDIYGLYNGQPNNRSGEGQGLSMNKKQE